MIVTKERNLKFFSWTSPLISLIILFVGIIIFYAGNRLLGFSILINGILWLIFSFSIVKPAYAGLMFRLGRRVIVSETIRYFKKIDGKERDISVEEFNASSFDPSAPDVKSEVISVEYLTKKEGWTFIIPIVENIVQISLRQHQAEINMRKKERAKTNIWIGRNHFPLLRALVFFL